MWAEMLSSLPPPLASSWVVQLQSMCCEPCKLTMRGSDPQLWQELRDMEDQKLGGYSSRNMGSSVILERAFLTPNAKDLGAPGSEMFM